MGQGMVSQWDGDGGVEADVEDAELEQSQNS